MKTEGSNTVRSIVLAAVVAGVVATLSTWFLDRSSLSNQVAQAAPAADVYQNIRSRGSIRAAYYVGAPYFTIDPNTKKKGGIFFQVVEGMGKKLNLKVEWTEEVGFGEMIEGLRSRRFDIVGSGIWINAARGNEADFTAPVLYDVVFAYARVGDQRFDSKLGMVNSPAVRISVIDGEMASTIAGTDFPLAKTEALPQSTDFTQMILNVVAKKADITFLGLATARKYEEANPGQIYNVAPDHPLRVFPAAIMLPQGQYSLKRAMDIALEEMLNNNEVESIILQNEDVPGSHYRVAPTYTNPASRK